MSSDLFLAAEAESAQLLEIIEFMVEGTGWSLIYKPRVESAVE